MREQQIKKVTSDWSRVLNCSRLGHHPLYPSPESSPIEIKFDHIYCNPFRFFMSDQPHGGKKKILESGPLGTLQFTSLLTLSLPFKF